LEKIFIPRSALEIPVFEAGIDLQLLCRLGFRGEVRPRFPAWMSDKEERYIFVQRCVNEGCDGCELRRSSKSGLCPGLLLKAPHAKPEIYAGKKNIVETLSMLPCGKHGITVRSFKY